MKKIPISKEQIDSLVKSTDFILYDGGSDNVDLIELKKWIDLNIYIGKKTCSIDIYTDHSNGPSEIKLRL